MPYLSFVTLITVLYVLWDVNYFVRSYFTIWFGRMFQRTHAYSETTRFYDVCAPQDVDVSLRMRTSRLLRALDFARYHYWERTGLRVHAAAPCGTLQAATHVVLDVARAPALFCPYRIDTELVWWDARSLIMRHRVWALGDSVECASLLSRQHLTGVGARELLSSLGPPPHCPDDVMLWLRSVDAMSEVLRNKYAAS